MKRPTRKSSSKEIADYQEWLKSLPIPSLVYEFEDIVRMEEQANEMNISSDKTAYFMVREMLDSLRII